MRLALLLVFQLLSYTPHHVFIPSTYNAALLNTACNVQLFIFTIIELLTHFMAGRFMDMKHIFRDFDEKWLSGNYINRDVSF